MHHESRACSRPILADPLTVQYHAREEQTRCPLTVAAPADHHNDLATIWRRGASDPGERTLVMLRLVARHRFDEDFESVGHAALLRIGKLKSVAINLVYVEYSSCRPSVNVVPS